MPAAVDVYCKTPCSGRDHCYTTCYNIKIDVNKQKKKFQKFVNNF